MIKKNIKLPPGNYDYRITKPGFGMIYDNIEVIDKDISINKVLQQDGFLLKIVPTPLDAIVKIEINGHFVDGKEFTLSPGIYNYQVTKSGFGTSTGSVAVVDRDVTKNVSLEGTKYRLVLLCDYSDAIIEVEINGVYVKGGVHRLTPGFYNYRVNRSGYTGVTGSATIIDKDVVIPITFTEDNKTLTFNVTPSDANVEVQIGRNWVSGKVHNLTPGKYTYVVNKSGYKDVINTVEIIDKNVNVRHTLYKDITIPHVLTRPIIESGSDPWRNYSTSVILSDSGKIYGFYAGRTQTTFPTSDILSSHIFTNRYSNLNNYAPFSHVACFSGNILAIDKNGNIINMDGSKTTEKSITESNIIRGNFKTVKTVTDVAIIAIDMEGKLSKLNDSATYVNPWNDWIAPSDKNHKDIVLMSDSYMALMNDGSIYINGLSTGYKYNDHGPYSAIFSGRYIGTFLAIRESDGKLISFTTPDLNGVMYHNSYVGIEDDPNNVDIVSVGRDRYEYVINNKGKVFEIYGGKLDFSSWHTMDGDVVRIETMRLGDYVDIPCIIIKDNGGLYDTSVLYKVINDNYIRFKQY